MKVRQKVALVFTLRIKLLLVIILVKMLYKISNFKIAFFRLKLKKVTLSSIWQSDAFSNTITRRMWLIYIKQIIARYKYKVFKTTLPIYRELLLYILYTTHSIKLGNWARYSTTAFIV